MDSRPDRTKARIDRDEIARIAGVSAATVSRVFNNPDLVSEAKRELVLTAANAAGYKPNKAASSLRRMRSGEIFFVERSFAPNYYWGSPRMYPWYYAEALRAVSKTLQDTHLSLSIVQIRAASEISKLATERKPDGLFFFDLVQDDVAEAIAELEGLGFPAIAGHHVEHFSGIARCMTDNRAGGKLAGSKLREKGYSKPVYVASEVPASYVHSERWAGFRSAFEPGETRLLVCETGKEGGYKAGLALADDIKKRKIDSIGVVNDYTAIGVILSLYELGIRIPEDVAIVAYDNLPFTEALPFKLASVDLGIEKIYAEGAKSLRDMILSGTPSQVKPTVQVPPVFVDGASL